MGKSQPGADSGEYASIGQRQVLQGCSAVCPLLWQQDMEPHDYRLSAARGVSHSRSLPDGRETQAKEGTTSQVGIPAVLRHLTVVRYGHHIALH
jgi:hypothetical protein